MRGERDGMGRRGRNSIGVTSYSLFSRRLAAESDLKIK
jgi:hypothetical protein